MHHERQALPEPDTFYTIHTAASSVLLHEPLKDKVLAWKLGDPIPREADVILEDQGKTIEARVDVAGQKLEFWNEVPGMQAPYCSINPY